MKQKILFESVRNAYEEKRRLVVPLMGFPGLNLTGGTIKLAQQNYGEHFKVIKSLVDKYQPDAIFPLMDLSVEANALGRFTVFPKEESATVVKDDFSVDELINTEKLNIGFDTRLVGYVETIKMMSIGLPQNVLRGAYVTGPYTLAALLMGADEAALSTVMNPSELHKVCEFAIQKICDYVRLVVSAGAQMICVLEPSAVMLGPEQFEEFSAAYVKQISDICVNTGISTIYHICGNSMHLIEKMSLSGVDALSLDSPETGVDLKSAAEQVPENIIVIGNINPVGSLLRGKPSNVADEVTNLLKVMEPFPNFILSSGCDLPQEVPAENINAFMKAGRDYNIPKNHFHQPAF